MNYGTLVEKAILTMPLHPTVTLEAEIWKLSKIYYANYANQRFEVGKKGDTYEIKFVDRILISPWLKIIPTQEEEFFYLAERMITLLQIGRIILPKQEGYVQDNRIYFEVGEQDALLSIDPFQRIVGTYIRTDFPTIRSFGLDTLNEIKNRMEKKIREKK